LKEMPALDWVYPARIDYETARKRGPFVDGDTFIIERMLDQQGLREGEVWVRLLEVDTAELTGATQQAGAEAAAWTSEWLVEAQSNPGRWPLLVQTVKKDSFGRHLAYVWCRATGKCINDEIIEAGYSGRISALEQLSKAGGGRSDTRV
jgi:endonuclease YncB( thermonuclease family)